MKISNIKKKVQMFVATNLAMMTLVVSGVFGLSATVAAEPTCTISSGNSTAVNNIDNPLSDGSACAKGNGQGENLNNIFKTVANILLFVVGAVAVIMLIIGGLRYVTSNGDQNAVTGAKNTIMYALIGIVVAFLAFAAVNFVTSQLENANTTS